MKQIYILLILAVFQFSGCGGISMISSHQKVFYRDSFIEKLDVAKKAYANGKVAESIGILNQMNASELLPVERAMKNNFLGVIYFGQKSDSQAIDAFTKALSTSSIDPALTARIYLNLASTYYRLGMFDKAYSQLILGDASSLKLDEQRKYYNLMFETAKQRGGDRDIISSLTYYLGTYKTINELKASIYFETLQSYLGKFSHEQKMHFFDEMGDKGYLIIGYLAFMEAERLYYSGKRDDAIRILDWVKDRFENYKDLQELVTILENKQTNLTKINKKKIAVILPFTGKKAKFSQRVLVGIEFWLKQQKLDYELIIKDSMGSPSVGAQMAKRVIEKDGVAVVIGGLFSAEGKQEYVVTRQLGALFVSLSQIYADVGSKDHLLIEIPGSVESQLDVLFNSEFLDAFGKRAAILYPNTLKGKSYARRFWEMAIKNGVTIKSIQSYEKGKTDLRKPVKKILGLGFPRQRAEELKILKEIYSLEKYSSIKRIQTLSPVIDFEWVFLPVSPRDALQIIPSFSYYDAFKLNIIGTPEWRSKRLFNESRKLGKLFFIASDLASSAVNYSPLFEEIYKRRLGLIEMNSIVALQVVDTLLKDENSGENRMQFDLFLRNTPEVKLGEISWNKQDGIWLKKVNLLKLKRGHTDKVDYKSMKETLQLKKDQELSAPKMNDEQSAKVGN